jgi:sacsin
MRGCAGTLVAEQLAHFQGPALYVYNDAEFQEADFESISSVGDSQKRGKAGKTGRFGVGFNSVYHLTDLATFVSGRHLIMFDPNCSNLPNVSASNPGKKLDFVASKVWKPAQ